ncbi:hypothetical protein [Brevibacillus laterosporus]|uniref:hypothetical protein n=1 Tax=Brevibacillus laterosporus TaxID=1465 RepID=UPI00215D1C13|nr:hypothetical protein [Brevibacillus laterosporus]MCR8994651.1 hypothetical protein [Brevibacillus laterosporus]
MEHIDLKLRLFGGLPVEAKGFGIIEPLKIREIIEFGYSDYMKCLNLISLELSDIVDDKEILNDEEITPIDFLLAFGGEEIERMIEKALSFFLKGEAIVDKDNLQVLVNRDDAVCAVNRNNYINIQDIIKWQNYVNSFEEKNLDNFNPADEEARKFKEKMERLKKEREKAKKRKSEADNDVDDGGNIDFFDILSSISSMSNSINELNVLDLTIYQVYRKFKRMQIIDQYDISIKSTLAGAKDIKIRHWSSKG